MFRARRNSNTRRSAERGVTLVEYALILSALAAVAIGAAQSLNDGADAFFTSSSQRISQPINSAHTYSDLTPVGGATTTTITTPTASSTTAVPSTTTLASHTSTALADVSTWSGRGWSAAARVTVTATAGDSVSGLTVSVTITGGSRTRAVTCVTNSSGICSVSEAMSASIASAVATVTAVSGSAPWSGSVASVTLTP